MKLALNRQILSEPTGDLSARLDRIRRRSAAPVQREDGSEADPCEDAGRQLRAALDVLVAASEHIRAAATHVIAAAGEGDEGARALLAEKYDDARQAVEALSAPPEEEVDEDGYAVEADLALTQVGCPGLAVPLRGATYAVAPFPLTTGEEGLGLTPPEDGFATSTEVAATLRRVEIALERIERVRDVYDRDARFLATQVRRADLG